MNKHAFLIIAHNQFNLLKILLKQIDNEKNDIYLLIDKKANFYDTESIKKSIKSSNLFIIESMKVYWGDFSQIEAELALFKEAQKKQYSYYHLISGVDLLLKSSEEIYEFFENSNQTEFVQFDEENIKDNITSQRYNYFWLFVKHRNKNIIRLFSTCLLKIQILFHITRHNDKNIKFAKGPNWVSITHDFVTYLLNQEEFIINTFKKTLCCDEVFLQTILYNSPFYNKKSQKGNLRLVIWKNSDDKSPKVLTNEDYNIIKSSNAIFARKFNIDIDKNIIKRICLDQETRRSL